jgi:hypothetical protein
VSHGVIDDGTLVIADDKLVAVGGPQTPVPPGASIYDASGMTVYPGLIDALDSDGVTNGAINQSQARHHEYPLGTPVPDLSVATAIKPTENIFVDRLNGVLNAGVSPGTDGPEPGQAAFIQFTDDRAGMVLAPNLALVLNFGKGSQRKDAYPSTAFGVAGFFRQQLTQLRDYRSGVGLRGADGKQIPDPRLVALIPFADGQRPIFAYARSDAEIGVALDIAQEFGLQIVLVGASGADQEIDRIAAAKVPVIRSYFFASCAPATSWREDCDRDIQRGGGRRAQPSLRGWIRGCLRVVLRRGVACDYAKSGRDPGLRCEPWFAGRRQVCKHRRGER